MTDFIFRIQPNIMLGTHIISRVGQSILDYGSKFMLLCDPVLRDVDLIDKVVDSLEEKQISLFVFDEIPSSATSEALEQALSLARGAYVDGIITLGGIKTASLGRSVAALYRETGLLYDYLDGKPATTDPLPFFSIMTTCRDPFLFTEFTPVIDGRNRQVKLLKIKSGFTKIVFSDPNLFGTLPKNTSISILMDTLSLAIEAYISTKSNFFSDTVLEKSIELLTQSLDATLALSSVASPATLAAQGGILAALGCGMTSPGASTALALSVNARYKISKSLVSTIMLPYLLEDSINSRVEKLDRISKIMGAGRDGMTKEESAQALITHLRDLLAQTNMPTRLKDLNLAIEDLVAAAEDVGSLEIMNFIPRALSTDDLFDLIKQAF